MANSTTPFATITNKANLTGVDGRGNSTVITTNPSTDVNLSEKIADLRIGKTAEVMPRSKPYASNASGAEVVYTLVVQNLRPKDGSASQIAKTVTVTDDVTNLITNAVADAAGVKAYAEEANTSANVKRYIQAHAYKPGEKEEIPGACKINGASTRNSANVTCTFSQMPVSDSDEYKVVIRAFQYVDAKSAGDMTNTIRNTAKVQSPDTAEVNKDNNEDFADIILSALTDLKVEKKADPVQAAAGQAITYTLSTTNVGPSKAENVKLVDQLPVGAIWVGNAPTINNGTCKLSGNAAFADGLVITSANNTMTCTWSSAFGANSGTDVLYRLRSASQNYPASLDNQVDVSTDTTEVDLTNNHAEKQVPLSLPEVDVLINMRHTADGLPLLTKSTQYTITVTNSGKSASYATGVNMTNLFPAQGSTAEFRFDQLVAVKGDKRFSTKNCKVLPDEATARELVCDFPWLAVGESVDIVFTMTPTALMEGRPVGTINHIATVSADVERLNAGGEALNNQAKDRTSTYDPSKISPEEAEKLRYVDLSVTKTATSVPVGGISQGDSIG